MATVQEVKEMIDEATKAMMIQVGQSQEALKDEMINEMKEQVKQAKKDLEESAAARKTALQEEAVACVTAQIRSELDSFHRSFALIQLDLIDLKKKETEDKPKRILSLAEGKGLMTLPMYDGSPEAYEDWSFKARAYMEDRAIEYKTLIKFLEESDVEPTGKEADPVIQDICNKAMIDPSQLAAMDGQLYHLLSLKTSGSVLLTVMNLKDLDANRGLVSWYRILRSSRGKAKLRVHEVANRIMNPIRVKTYGEVPQAIERLEKL